MYLISVVHKIVNKMYFISVVHSSIHFDFNDDLAYSVDIKRLLDSRPIEESSDSIDPARRRA
jgi:hypothetical protein